MADSSNRKLVAYSGFAVSVPKHFTVKQTTTYSNQSKQGGQTNFNTKTIVKVPKQTGSYTRATNREVISSKEKSKNISHVKVDKQTGSYARATKEVIWTREAFKERSTGRVGHKDEYKNTSTCRYGDKNGYTEHRVQERVRKVSYGGTSSSNNGKKKYIK